MLGIQRSFKIKIKKNKHKSLRIIINNNKVQKHRPTSWARTLAKVLFKTLFWDIKSINPVQPPTRGSGSY